METTEANTQQDRLEKSRTPMSPGMFHAQDRDQKQGDRVSRSRSTRVSRPTLHGAVQVYQQVGGRAKHAGLPGLEGRVATNVPKTLAC